MADNRAKIAMALGGVLLLAGCASISVQPGSETSTMSKPKKVYVEAFNTSRGIFNVDREGKELADFKTNLQSMMTAGITYDLTKRLVPAVPADKHKMDVRESAWLIRGEFVQVNQGSRLLRGVVGFGAGATKMVCKVEVYNLADLDWKPFLTFTTMGGSNAEPGAVSAIATDPLTLVIEAAASGAGNVAHGITEDTNRTARVITSDLSDYMYRRHWITEDQWVKPKAYTPEMQPPPSMK